MFLDPRLINLCLITSCLNDVPCLSDEEKQTFSY